MRDKFIRFGNLIINSKNIKSLRYDVKCSTSSNCPYWIVLVDMDNERYVETFSNIDDREKRFNMLLSLLNE